MPRCTFVRREVFLFVAIACTAIALFSCFAAQRAVADGAKPELKIFMICDMEGTSGLFERDQTWYKAKGVPKEVAEQGIKLMIDDVNSAVAAVLKAGADRVIVCDVHGGGGNLRLDQMLADPRVTYELHERSFEGSVRRWMPGLDASVSGVILMGHHAKAGTPHSFLPHTSNPDWLDFTINGQSVGEIGYEGCYAGYWGVPVILIHGDEALGREAEAIFPGVVTACVKHAEDDTNRATGLDPDAAHKLVAEKIAEAMKKLQSPERPAPYKPTLPMRVTIRMKSATSAENASKKPGAMLIDAHTVECEVARQGDVVKWLKGDGAP
jgi:D-amino peptidase